MAKEQLKATVLMPVFNGEKYLREAIHSVLWQTFQDFEFLIINDGSTDNSRNIIESYRDPRIRLIDNEANLKLIASLNIGMNLARGQYIIRMDADDICFPYRLEKQIEFMEKNPTIVASGTGLKPLGKLKFTTRPSDPDEIKCTLLFHCCLNHPTMIFRKDALGWGNFFYNPNYTHAEDYELWVRLANHFSLSNLNEVLLSYRLHSRQVSNVFSIEQKRMADEIRRNQLQILKINPTDEQLTIHKKLYRKGKFKTKEEMVKTYQWIELLLTQNQQVGYFPQRSLKNVIDKFLARKQSTEK